MAFCIQCGSELRRDARFCSACGHGVGLEGAASEKAAVSPSSGAPLPESSPDSREDIAASDSLTASPPSQGRRNLIIGLVAAVVVVGGATGWLLTRSGGDDVAAAPTTTSTIVDAPAAQTTTSTTTTSLPTTTTEGAPDLAVTVTGTPLPLFDPSVSDAAVGAAVPVLAGPAPDGGVVTIGGDSAPRLLMVAAHWCPHCQAELPRVVDLADSDGRINGVEVVAIASSNDAAAVNFPAADWFDREGWQGRLMIDDSANTAMAALGGTAFPYWLAVDATGRLAARATGEMEPESLLALAAVAAGDVAAASDATVTVLTLESGDESAAFEAGLEPLVQTKGLDIVVSTGSGIDELSIALAAGSPPDIAVVFGPIVVSELAEDGFATPLPAEISQLAAASFDQGWVDSVTQGGDLYGIPVQAGVRSLVWYNRAVWDDRGYIVPTTWDELEALMIAMRADGEVPWGIGIESGSATGWVFTDWMEDVLLRLHGPDVYDQWVRHEIPFTDPRVREAAELVRTMWFEEGNVLGGGTAVVSTSFGDAGRCVETAECMMHRQANFYGWFSDWDQPGVGEDIDVFYLPPIGDDFGRVMIGSGLYAVALADRPEVMAVMEHLTTEQYANGRIRSGLGTAISPNRSQDTSLYPYAAAGRIAEILVGSGPFRFDASDSMPPEVGAGEFWAAATDYVDGKIDVDEMLARIEAAWP